MADRLSLLKAPEHRSSKNQPQKSTKGTKELKQTVCAFWWLSSISWRAGLRAVARSRSRQRRQTLTFLQRHSHRRCCVPVALIQPLKLRELSICFVFLLQPRVRKKELVVHPWIFRVQLNSARQQRHRFFVSPQLHQQPPEIVIRRKPFRIELDRASQQTLRLNILATLTRDITEIRNRIRIIRLQLQRLLKRSHRLVVLPFRTPRITEQEIEVRIVRITLERFREYFTRTVVMLSTHIRDTESQKINQLTLRLFERLFIERDRLLRELPLEQLFTDHEVDLRKHRPQLERPGPVCQRGLGVVLCRSDQAQPVIRISFIRFQRRRRGHRLLRFS